MGVTITQSASSASRTGSGQSHEIALMATKKSLAEVSGIFFTVLRVYSPILRHSYGVRPNRSKGR